jgi:hypothetical protein
VRADRALLLGDPGLDVDVRHAGVRGQPLRRRPEVHAGGGQPQLLGGEAARAADLGQERVGDLHRGVERGFLGREEVAVGVAEQDLQPVEERRR